jgi:hypothetical protein
MGGWTSSAHEVFFSDFVGMPKSENIMCPQSCSGMLELMPLPIHARNTNQTAVKGQAPTGSHLQLLKLNVNPVKA